MTPVPLLSVRNLSKTYRGESWHSPRSAAVRALSDVTFEITSGSTLGLVGRSGSGKSTLARCIVRLETADAGEVWYGNQNLSVLTNRKLRHYRRALQIVFQHSALAINPRFTSLDTVIEPLLIQQIGSFDEQRQSAREMLRRVGLSAAFETKRSLLLSGGERQRLALARALILHPKLLVLDEALSGLDAPTQSDILKLLLEIQREFDLSYLFITHDLLLAARIASDIAVLESGRIVEIAPAQVLLSKPCSQSARRLVEAIIS